MPIQYFSLKSAYAAVVYGMPRHLQLSCGPAIVLTSCSLGVNRYNNINNEIINRTVW